MKQGSYGAHMLDPVLLAPRSWSTSKPVPARPQQDPSEVRPLHTDVLGHKRNRVVKPVVSEGIVRTTKAHKMRAQMMFSHMDKIRDEHLLEQVRFENGMYEGRWR